MSNRKYDTLYRPVLGPVSQANAADAAIGSSIDTKGFRSLEFLMLFGAEASSATITAKVQDSADDSTFADVHKADGNDHAVSVAEGVDSYGNKLARITVDCTLTERYVRLFGTFASGPSLVGVLAALSDPEVEPITEEAVAADHVNPESMNVS